jgi:hypothetical protein
LFFKPKQIIDENENEYEEENKNDNEEENENDNEEENENDNENDNIEGWNDDSNGEPIYDKYYTVYDNIEYFIKTQDKKFNDIKEIYDYVIEFYLTNYLLINPQYINNVINTLAIKNNFISKDKLFFDYFYYEPTDCIDEYFNDTFNY